MKYAADLPSDPITGANIAPLVGIFMALAIVFLVGAVPAATTRFDAQASWGCRLCAAGHCEPVGELRVTVTGAGLANVNGRSVAIPDLRSLVEFDPASRGAERFSVQVEAEPGAEYGEVLQVLAQLRQEGFGEHQIQIRD